MFADQGYKILWVAHWFIGSPTVPGNNWGGKGWTFWQYDDCGSVPGITTGCVDLDRYHNTDFTSITYGADFHVAAGTDSSTVKQGHGASVGVALNRTWFTLPIGMTVTGLPAGARAGRREANAKLLSPPVLPARDAVEGYALNSLGLVLGYLGDIESGREKLRASRGEEEAARLEAERPRVRRAPTRRRSPRSRGRSWNGPAKRWAS